MKRFVQALLLAAMAALLAVLAPSPALGSWTPYGAGVGAGVLLAVCLLLGLRRHGGIYDARIDPMELALVCVPAAFIGARLSYCLVRFGFYFLEMGPLSVFRVFEGGFLLYGAAAGAMLAAALLARRRGADIAVVLDEIAAPGMLVIAVSRLCEGMTTEGVGAWIESEWMMRFPFAVLNEYEEWQLAVFLPEALAAAMILLVVLRAVRGRGERIMTAALLYACCQVFFESLRMDGCLKIGFVRVSQVASAVVILIVTMIRARRAGGRKQATVRAVPVAVCVAVIGIIEWALDKTPVSNVLLHSVMALLCAVMAVNGMLFQKKAR